MTALTLPTEDDVRAAREALAGQVVRTPVLSAEGLVDAAGRPVLAKAEALQVTGSFKVRGALNRIRTLPDETLSRGLITISAGNAALGAAHAARVSGARLTVVMPENAVPEKLAAVRGYGARVVCEGITDAAAAFARADELRAGEGLTLVHPFDDPMVVAGAATATVELLEDAPQVQRLYVPCSGGGLLAGAILAVRTLGRDVEVVGVQPEGADGFVRSLAAGVPTRPPVISTVADGLTAPHPGAVNFEVVRAAGTRIMTVSDKQILDALTLLIHSLRVVAEPSGAVGLAGLTADDAAPGTSAFIVSGSNASRQMLAEALVR